MSQRTVIKGQIKSWTRSLDSINAELQELQDELSEIEEPTDAQEELSIKVGDSMEKLNELVTELEDLEGSL